jgi:serine/threonine-protein kinase
MGEEVDGRADQYTLAATAYHLLTGSQLFPHSNPAVVISRHLNAEPPSLSELRPELAAMDSVLARALAKDPKDRFMHCSDFAQALAERATGTASHSAAAPTKPAPATAPKPTNNRPALERAKAAAEALGSRPSKRWLAASAVVAVIVAGAVVALVSQPWEQNQPSTLPTTSRSATPPPAASGIASPGPPPIARASTPDPSAGVVPETQTETTVAVVNGQPANGFREVLNISNSELAGCESSSPAAVSPNIYYCYPSAAGADLCWPAPPASMLCLDDPWAKGLHRFAFDTAYLTTMQPPSSPRPFALLLDDDTRCRFISGGARGDRPDGYLPAYNCGTAGSTLAVLMGPNATDPIDRSTPLWTVRVAPLGSPPQTRSVATAWFAGN